MKFAHFADVHIGSWRDPKLTPKSTEAFIKAIEDCRKHQVDFIIISGDLFDTALPPINLLKDVVVALRQLQEANIPVYLIPGSHDYSSSGKSMLDVLESAGLCTNVMKGQVKDNKVFLNFVEDKKTGVKLTGIIGKKGMLDRHYYRDLELSNLEQEQGAKIFLFHTAIAEFKPKELEKMDAIPLSLFPKRFAYYAGGHVHQPLAQQTETHPLVTMPGPLFPVNFKEIEKLQHGGFYLVELIDNKASCEFVPIILHPVVSLRIDAQGKTPEELITDTAIQLQQRSLTNALVTLRFVGTLISGKPSSIDFSSLFSQAEQQQAYIVLKNTSKLFSEEFKEVAYPDESIELIEERVLNEHLGQSKIFSPEEEKELARSLLNALATEKHEGETSATFEERLKHDIKQLLNIEL